MKSLLYTLTILLLTACGEVAEGVTAENTKIATEIFADVEANREALEADAAREGKLVPPAFRNGEPCSFVPKEAILAFDPDLSYAPVGEHATHKGSTNYANKHSLNCTYNNMQGLQESIALGTGAPEMSNVSVQIYYDGFGSAPIFESQEPYYDEVDVAGMDRVLVNKNGAEVIGVTGNYSITLHSLVLDNEMTMSEIGRERVFTLLGAIAANLPGE